MDAGCRAHLTVLTTNNWWNSAAAANMALTTSKPHTHTHTHTLTRSQPTVRPRCNQCTRHALGITIDLTGARTTDIPVRWNSLHLSLGWLATGTLSRRHWNNDPKKCWLHLWTKLGLCVFIPLSIFCCQQSIKQDCCISSHRCGFKSRSPQTAYLCLFPAALRFLWAIQSPSSERRKTPAATSHEIAITLREHR